MSARLFIGESASIDLLLDQRMIASDPFQSSVAEPVGPAVADVADDVRARPCAEGGDGRAHPGASGIAPSAVQDALIGLGDRGLERCGKLGHLAHVGRRGEPLADKGRGDLGRHLASRVAAHSVGHHEDAGFLIGVEPVFVALANSADVGGGRVVRGQWHCALADGRLSGWHPAQFPGRTRPKKKENRSPPMPGASSPVTVAEGATRPAWRPTLPCTFAAMAGPAGGTL